MKKKEGRSKKNDYVNNDELRDELTVYRKEFYYNKEHNLPRPQMSPRLGELISLMANHISYSANFINYEFRVDMIGDAIVNCVNYIHNYNPEVGSNAFAYTTQIIRQSFIRTIVKEKKHAYTLMEIFASLDKKGDFIKWAHSEGLADNCGKDGYAQFFRLSDRDIEKFSAINKKNKTKKKKSTGTNLDDIME